MVGIPSMEIKNDQEKFDASVEKTGIFWNDILRSSGTFYAHLELSEMDV